MRSKNPYARPDARTRAAKALGYPARSVFKLKELDERYKLLRGGMRVLDLGAAPGSWSLYASERVGPAGRVVAVDLTPMKQAFGQNVETVVGDALDPAFIATLPFAPYDVVLSDMAPKTSGDKWTDRMRSAELFMGALDVASRVGKAGSSFVGKILMGEDFPAAQRSVRERFDRMKTTKPAGTRSTSTEIYLIGFGLRRA